jgi:hypothetical protein
MSKEKLEKDYENFNLQIEKLAKEAIDEVHVKANAIKAEAEKISTDLESSLSGKEIGSSSKNLKKEQLS